MGGVTEDFSGGLCGRWRRHVRGQGSVEQAGGALRFINASTSSSQYTNAQIDDYQRLSRRRFPWHPPLQLTVRARFSHEEGSLSGTAGFGFWNDPFLMTQRRIPAPPRAIWFFYSSAPSDIKLDVKAPGRGWKAATIDALRPAALLLAPLAVPAALLMNVPSLYRVLWPPVQRALHVRESLVAAAMTEWHTYRICWGVERATFSVDGEGVLAHAPSPGAPLGFVMWLDNQYMVVKPWGRFRWGLLEEPSRQWMEVERLVIETGLS